jgi:hypothetical protein
MMDTKTPGGESSSTRRAALLALACLLLASPACIPTDPPQDNDGFVPFDPDAGAEVGVGDDLGPGTDGGGLDDLGPTSDGGAPDAGGGDDMGGGVGGCEPNFDGTITRAEVPIAAGLEAKYQAATDAPIDLEGTMENGTRVWDFSMMVPGDEPTLVVTKSPEGQWWAPEFTKADYAAVLSLEDDLLGVFDIDDDGLFLLGVVSPEQGFGDTLLTYDPPVEVLDFPMSRGDSWSTDTNVSGRTSIYPFSNFDESYTSQVDARGAVDTPFGRFDDALRVRVELERTIGFSTTKIRTFFFVNECFGTIVTVQSKDNEDTVEFTEAAELRRLTR